MKGKIILVAVATAATFTVASPALAVPAGPNIYPASDDQIAQVINHINASGGAVSSTDRSTLMTRPDIAAQIPDPSLTTVSNGDMVAEVKTPAVEPSSVTAKYATRTRSVDRYINYFGYTGGKVLEYHFTITWNYNGSIVTSVPSRGHWVRALTAGVKDYGVTSSATKNGSGYAYTVPMQGKWAQCIKYLPCLGPWYPYTKYGVYFDGTYHIQQVR